LLSEIWDEKLVEYGNIISNYRREFINKIIEKINIIHKKITNDNEKIDIIYTSCCENKKNCRYPTNFVVPFQIPFVGFVYRFLLGFVGF
jgi:recombinational DNA repair ATPase RecF